MKLNIESGLDVSVFQCTGRLLMVDLENGWGWRKLTGGRDEEVNLDVYYNRRVHFRAVEILCFDGIARGVRGVMVERFCSEVGQEIIALALSDGFDYNFENFPCACWRLCFGNGDFSISGKGDLLFSGDRIMGWGREVRTEG